MDKKVAKTSGGVTKKKGVGGVSSAVYGAVASATGSGGAPTSFKSSNKSRRQAKLKTQERIDAKDVDEAAAAAATLADLTTKVNFKTLMEGKEKKEEMEYKEGQQQQTTPMIPTGEFTLPMPETAAVTSIDVDDEDLPHSSFDTMLDYSPATRKRKKQVKTPLQRAAAGIKEKALKRARMVPPSMAPNVKYSTDLLEDPFLKKIASDEKDVFKDIANSIASKEKVEKQLQESSRKLQELSSESEALKQKEVELLTELEELRKAAKTSTTAKRDLEQAIETYKAELEQSKQVSLKIQSEAAAEREEKNQKLKEIEAKNANVLCELEQERIKSDRTTQAADEAERRAAEAMANNQEEIQRLRRDIEADSAARATEMSVLQTENESRQTRIRELEEILQSNTEAGLNQRTALLEDIRTKKRDIETLQNELLANKNKVDAETASLAEKASHLEAAEARIKQLERQLAELHRAKEEERKQLEEWARDISASSDRKMKDLQAQLEEKEAQFMQSAKADNDELRERFEREKEILQRELEKTATSQIAATQTAEEARKESEKIKASLESADRLAKEAEERRALAEKKEMERTNELQEIQKKVKEESERLNREKHDLIKRLEDAERQHERQEKEKQEAMAVERYEVAATPVIPPYQNIVTDINNAMGMIQTEVMARNQMFIEDVTKSINDLKNNISSSGQELATLQDTRLTAGIKRFGDLIKSSINKDVEIQEAMNDIIKQMDETTAENQTRISTALDVVKQLGDRIVQGMDHDDPSHTNKFRLTWNLIKQSLINIISTAYTEINTLRTAVRKNSAIRDKEYVEFAKKAAERTFLLLLNNKDLKNILVQLGIRVTFYSRDTGISLYEPAIIDPEILEVEVKSAGNDLEADIKTINIKMSMASVTYREIETVLSGVRVIAAQFANKERQSLQEVEINKIVANLEDSTASRLYYELDKFYFLASAIENPTLFQNKMRENTSLLNVFSDAIPFMGSKKDNRGIMEFLMRKGYSIKEDTASSIDNFMSGVLGVTLMEDSERERRKMDENVFVSTVIGILATISEAIRKINNKIEEERKQNELRTNQMESKQYLEEQLQNQIGFIAQYLQPTSTSISAEFEEIEGETCEKISRDIDSLIDSAVRDTKIAYESVLDKLTKQQHEESVKIIQAQAQQLDQQRQVQEQLQEEKQQREQEYMKRAFHEELEKQTTRKQQTIDMLQQQQQNQTTDSPSPAPPPPPPPPPPPSSSSSSSTPSRGPEVGNGEGLGGGRNDDDCLTRVFNEAVVEFKSNVEQVHNNLKMSVERLIATLSTSSRITASDLSNLNTTADVYINDMGEHFRARSVNLPIDVLQKIKRQCNGQETLSDQLSKNISSIISKMDDELSGYRTDLDRRIAELQDREMEVTETGPTEEDKSARLAREMKELLTNALTRATIAAEQRNTKEAENPLANANDGGRNIKMFLKPEEGLDNNFVEVDLSSKDSGPRNINMEGLKKALPELPSEIRNKIKKESCEKMSKDASEKNTLTGKIFLDTIKDKVFPYSSKSALEDEDEDGGPAALYHPEYFRSSFSKHYIRDSTSFTEPLTSAEKTESVRNFTRLLEYSLFNGTVRGARSDNDTLSRLIYVVFEHDAKMIRYLSDITYKFREYASGRRESQHSSISLYKDRGNLLEATIATVFSAALPLVSSMAPRIAEAMSEPVHDDVRLRSAYSLLSLIEKFIFCASKRIHVLKNVLEKSGLVNRLSLYPAEANADRVTSFDVQYDYSLLRMLLELMTINITSLREAGIRPLRAVVFSIGTFTGAVKTRETNRALIPIDSDRSILSKVSDSDIDVPKTTSVVNCLSAVTNWYIAKRLTDDDDAESLNKALNLMRTLLTDNLSANDKLAVEFNTKFDTNQSTKITSSAIVEYVSKTVLPRLNTIIEKIVKGTKSNDAILVKGASEVGSLGETAMNVSIGVSREHLTLPWLEVDFRGGVDDSTLLWVLSGGVNSDEVVRDYQLAVPLYSSYFSVRRRLAAPFHVKPLTRIINNTSGSDTVFLTNNKKTVEGDGSGRVHVLHLAKNVSCVLEYSTKDRYEAIINKMYRNGLVLVKGDVEVPRVFPTLDGKWMDNSRDNMTFTPLSVSRWKIPSASLVYGMLSKKKTKEEEQNQDNEEKKNKTNTPSVIDFMGGRAGDVLLKMLNLPSEQPIEAMADSSSFETSNKGLWKTNKDGYTSIDAQSMMARLISDDKKPINGTAASSPSSMAMVPYSDAANIVINDPLEVYNSNNSWWIKGIQPSMRRDAAALSAVQEHLYFVQTPIF